MNITDLLNVFNYIRISEDNLTYGIFFRLHHSINLHDLLFGTNLTFVISNIDLRAIVPIFP